MTGRNRAVTLLLLAWCADSRRVTMKAEVGTEQQGDEKHQETQASLEGPPKGAKVLNCEGDLYFGINGGKYIRPTALKTSLGDVGIKNKCGWPDWQGSWDFMEEFDKKRITKVKLSKEQARDMELAAEVSKAGAVLATGMPFEAGMEGASKSDSKQDVHVVLESFTNKRKAMLSMNKNEEFLEYLKELRDANKSPPFIAWATLTLVDPSTMDSSGESRGEAKASGLLGGASGKYGRQQKVHTSFAEGSIIGFQYVIPVLNSKGDKVLQLSDPPEAFLEGIRDVPTCGPRVTNVSAPQKPTAVVDPAEEEVSESGGGLWDMLSDGVCYVLDSVPPEAWASVASGYGVDLPYTVNLADV